MHTKERAPSSTAVPSPLSSALHGHNPASLSPRRALGSRKRVTSQGGLLLGPSSPPTLWLLIFYLGPNSVLLADSSAQRPRGEHWGRGGSPTSRSPPPQEGSKLHPSLHSRVPHPRPCLLTKRDAPACEKPPVGRGNYPAKVPSDVLTVSPRVESNRNLVALSGPATPFLSR